jgi:iron complex transport system substrate-binding protein
MSYPRPYAALALLILAMAAGSVAGCTGSDEAAPAGPSASSAEAGEEGAADPSASTIVVTAGNGEVTFSDTPDAIVSLSPSLTEILFAVGAESQVIAVDSESDYPAGTPITDLSSFRPNVEAIGALEPDLVLLARDRDGIVASLEGVGIPVLLLEPPSGVEEVYDQIRTIGRATGNVQPADDLITAMQDDIDDLLVSAPVHDEPVNYFYELSGDYHTLTSDTFVGAVMDGAGLTNIADGVDGEAGAFPQLSAEYVLGADPALVFVAHTDGSMPTFDEIAGRSGWADLRAVTEGNVVVLDPDIASRWGPRLVDLVITVVEASSTVSSG